MIEKGKYNANITVIFSQIYVFRCGFWKINGLKTNEGMIIIKEYIRTNRIERKQYVVVQSLKNIILTN